MKKAMALIALMVVGSSAVADFNGKWEGHGTLSNSSGFKSPCIIEFPITQTPTSLVLEHRRVLCGFVDSDWERVTLAIKDNQLFIGKQEYGVIKGDEIIGMNYPGTLDENGKPLGPKTAHQEFEFKRTADGLYYREDWVDDNTGKVAMTIRGHLTQEK